MLKSLVLGAILGGLTAFIWSFISWSVLPWHEKQLRSFQNDGMRQPPITSGPIMSPSSFKEPVVPYRHRVG